MMIFHDLDLLFDEDDCICPQCDQPARDGKMFFHSRWHDDCLAAFMREYDQFLLTTEHNGEVLCTATKPEERSDDDCPF